MITTTEHLGLETRTRRPLVSWGSIFAGWLLGNAVMLLMMNFGSAIGLSAIDLNNPEAAAKGLAIGSAVWVLLTWAVSFFLSGFIAAWLAGNVDRAVGAVHGMTVWALAVAFTVILGVVGVTGAVNVGKSIGSGLMSAGTAAAGQAGDADVPSGLEAAIKDQIGNAAAAAGPQAGIGGEEARRSVQQLDRQALSAISASLIRGDVEGAKNQLAVNTDLNRQQIDGVVANLQAQTDEAKARAKDAADKAANYTAGAMWVIFFSGVFGLAAAALGGSAGSNRLVKSYRRFETV